MPMARSMARRLMCAVMLVPLFRLAVHCRLALAGQSQLSHDFPLDAAEWGLVERLLDHVEPGVASRLVRRPFAREAARLNVGQLALHERLQLRCLELVKPSQRAEATGRRME